MHSYDEETDGHFFEKWTDLSILVMDLDRFAGAI
jgi:hypothetical protein